jgi:ADP-dependent NAD(P)H-hydrate dehydratase
MTEERGLAASIDVALLKRWPLPELSPDGGKQQRGDVLVVGGSAQIPGAVLLTAEAALRAGAGRVQIASVHSAATQLAIALPEARVVGLEQDAEGELAVGCASALSSLLEACRALVLGPGMRSENAAVHLMQHLARGSREIPVILDAAALRGIGKQHAPSGLSANVIATPHAGEMAELWGCERAYVQHNAEQVARQAAETLGVVLVLKGATTFIAAPDGQIFRNTAGNPGLATAGSGDTLAGVIGGLAARGAAPLQAAVWGVWLHAKAGEALARKVGALGYLAREISAEIPRLLDLP